MNLSNSIKSYIEKNQDTFFTIAIVILLDHYLFEGALRSKIKTSVEGMIERFELTPGYSISRVIKGGWQLSEGHSTVEIRSKTNRISSTV